MFTGVAAWFAVVGAIGLGLLLAVVLALRWPAFDRSWPVRLLYGLVSFAFIDSVLFGLFPLRCVSLPAFVLAVATIPAAWLSAWRFGLVSIRTPAYCMLPALLVIVPVVGAANFGESAEVCGKVARTRGIHILVPVHSAIQRRGLPRFILRRPSHGDLLVFYRFDHSRPPAGAVKADRLVLSTGEVTAVTTLSVEIIGGMYDQERDRLYVVGVTDMTERRRTDPRILYVLDSDLKIETAIPFPGYATNDYSAFLAPQGDWVAIQSEGLFRFDPVQRSLVKTDVQCGGATFSRCRLLAETGFLNLGQGRYLLAGGGNPILYSLVSSSACECSLAPPGERCYRAPFGGAFSLALIPESGEVMATSLWVDRVWVFGASDLAHRRSLTIGPCVRPLAYDEARGVGLTHESFTGDLVAFDPQTGAEKGRVFVGRNARDIQVFDDLGIIVLSGCGVVRVEWQALRLPAAADRTAKVAPP